MAGSTTAIPDDHPYLHRLIVVWASATRLARKTLVGTVLFGAGLNIYELFAPMTFSRVIGRSAGL